MWVACDKYLRVEGNNPSCLLTFAHFNMNLKEILTSIIFEPIGNLPGLVKKCCLQHTEGKPIMSIGNSALLSKWGNGGGGSSRLTTGKWPRVRYQTVMR